MAMLYGYAGKILRVDLTSGLVSCIATMDYADRFLGGCGVAAKIYWDEVSPAVGALEPENRLIFMNGPLAGFKGISGSRWTVCAKTPTTSPQQFAMSNLGGRWGAQLKFAGYDGIVIQGRADKPAYISIEDDVVEIKDASLLWGKGTSETRTILKDKLGKTAAVVACGPAGESMVVFATLVADNEASGSSGMGAVMGSKNLKAIVVRGSGHVVAANDEKLKEASGYIHKLWKGLRPPGHRISETGNLKKEHCYGCFGDCPRAKGILEDGTEYKSLCGPPVVFHVMASMYYGDMNRKPAAEAPYRAVKLEDECGLDCFSVVNCLLWILLCSKAGIMTEESTGLDLSKFGSWEFMQDLLKKIALREGFGDILARGIWKAADHVGGKAKEMLTASPWVQVTQDGRAAMYCPRAFPVHGLLYATEPTLRMQQLHEMAFVLQRWLHWADKTYTEKSQIFGPERYHVDSRAFRRIAKRFWGSELAADFSIYEGKALAAKKIQDRSFVKESLGLCDYLFPITSVTSEEVVGDASVESRILSAVSGSDVDEEGLDLIGERIFNLRRAIMLRERGGRESDTIPEYMFTTGLGENEDNPKSLAPGKDGEVICLKGATVDHEKFERLKDEYYELRGWDVATGKPKKEKMIELGLQDIAEDLKREGHLT